MARKKPGRPKKAKGGKVAVKGYVRRYPKTLPKRTTEGKFKRGRGQSTGQTKLF